MSEYIHEVVLQDYIIDNITMLDLIIMYHNTSYKIIDARFNRSGTFWDLEGKLDNGTWIPIEVEWISDRFITHGHPKSKDFKCFNDKNRYIISFKKKSRNR